MRADLEAAGRLVHLATDPLSLQSEAAEALADGVERQFAVLGQIEEPLFTLVELLELLAKVGVDFQRQSLLFVERFLQLLLDRLAEVQTGRHGAVDILDEFFDLPDAHVGQVARSILTTAALEVGVDGARLASAFGVEQPALATTCVAASAAQATAQVVVVDARAASLLLPGIEQLLHTVEQVGVDDRFVSSLGDDLTLVDHDTGVIGVAQHHLELGD